MQKFQYRTPKGVFKTIPDVLKAHGFKPRLESYRQLQDKVPEAVREAAPGKEHIFERFQKRR